MNDFNVSRFLIATAIAGVPGVSFAQSVETSEPSGPFEDIIVTAQRTDQRLQDVPISVTAITAEEIETRQITTPTDIARLVPNVKLDAVTGGSAGLKAYIRGGGITDSALVTSESEVALYVNDVYNGRLQGALVDFAEIERIEVLRGPQGVLYGRNSSAGAINIITKAPANIFTGTVQAGYGSWNERRIKGYVSVPLTESGDWAFSANGMVRARDGGRQFNRTLNRKVGADDFHGGQFDLGYRGDDIKARLNLFYLNASSDGQYAVNTIRNAAGEIVPLSGSYRVVLSPKLSDTDVEQYGGSLQLEADYPGGTLKSITGYSELKDNWFQDFSGGVPASLLGQGGNQVFSLFERGSISQQWQFSQELQGAGEAFDGFVEYVVGAYYFHENAEQEINSTIFFAPSQTIFGVETDAFAGYGQFTFNVADALELVAGGRYTLEDKRLNATIFGVPVTRRDTFTRFTPKLGINYKPNPELLIYASYSEGFKSGGYNGLASNAVQLSVPFKPQITRAYELGIKAELGSTIRANLAGFYNRIKDRQQTVNLNNGGFLIENYNVEIAGVELEVAWRPIRGLQIWGNGALNQGKYLSSDSSIATLLNNEPPSLPDYEYTIGFDYSVPAGPGELSFGGDFNQRDEFFATPDNVEIGAVEKMEYLNAYVRYEAGPWDFQIAGKNLLQEIGWQTGFGFAVVNPRFATDPRTWMATVRYSF